MRLASTSSRVRASGARCSISSSNVRLASSISAHSSPRISTPWAAKRSGVDPPRLVAELLEPERVREPARGVDRDDRDLRAVGRGAHRERGRGRRLAHAAGAGADDDPLAGDQVRDGAGTQMSPSRTACATACERLRASELRHDVVQHVLHGALGIAELLGDLAGRDGRRRSARGPACSRSVRRAATDLPSSGLIPSSRSLQELGRHDAGAVDGGADRARRATRSSACPCAGRRRRPPAGRRARRARSTARSTRRRSRPSTRAAAPMKSVPSGIAWSSSTRSASASSGSAQASRTPSAWPTAVTSGRLSRHAASPRR